MVLQAILKRLVLPFVYATKGGYDAKRYWTDRFAKYGTSLLGPGNESRSEQWNHDDYENTKLQVKELLLKCGRHPSESKIVEVGCGTGEIAHVINGMGCTNYTGIDLTNVLFSDLANRFPDYKFKNCDITDTGIRLDFDILMMINVVEHIVDKKRFKSAMEAIRGSMAVGSIFIIGPVKEFDKKHLFYMASHSAEKIKSYFKYGFDVSDDAFRYGTALTIRRTK
jgi:2-polyprenyl-3-methyl-5-hydroxy-6-metoxy-1,4-benzoquinol methylase